MNGAFDQVLVSLPDEAAAARELPAGEALAALHGALRARVVDPVVRAAAQGDAAPLGDLEAVADVIRTCVPDGTERSLAPRSGILVRLLRADALDAAWMLARDNASGVVRPERATSMWAGGSNLSTELALPTRIDDDGRVFAWLPGFRDPRWSVPDEVYDITRFVVLRDLLEWAAIDAHGVLQLAGSAFLGQLPAEPDDEIVIRMTGPGGARHAVPAARLRRPELVKSSGPNLRRLAWGGWRVALPLEQLRSAAGIWRLRLEIAQGAVRRSGVLGVHRAPLAAPVLTTTTFESRAQRFRLDTEEKSGGLVLRVKPVNGVSRRLPPPMRAEARRLRARFRR